MWYECIKVHNYCTCDIFFRNILCLFSCIPRQVLPEDTLDSAALRRRVRRHRAHSCVRSNSCISWRISFKFCMAVYFGKIYTAIVFGDAAPSVPSFIGSKVIFWWKSCVRSARPHFLTDFFRILQRCASYSNLHTYSFWWCCPQCSVFYRVKGHILVHILVCALTAAFLDGFLSNFVWRCILVNSTRLLFLVMLPPVFRLL